VVLEVLTSANHLTRYQPRFETAEAPRDIGGEAFLHMLVPFRPSSRERTGDAPSLDQRRDENKAKRPG
jgi:hypothetical protein